MTFHILIPDRSTPPLDVEEAVVGKAATLTALQASDARQVSDEHWKSADALLMWHDVHLNEETIQKLKRCQVIVRIGVGFDNVDIAAAGKAGIQVCNVPDYGTEDVADHTMALLLTLSRGIFQYEHAARQDDWSWHTGDSLRRLRGSQLGIIGLGRIGIAMARRAQAHDIRVQFYDPYVKDGMDKALGLTRVESLTELAETSDTVSLHVPLTSETQNLVDATFLARMKPGSLLVNTCRGGTMDLDALHLSLASGRLRGAGLDVLPEEPPPSDHPLIRAWKSQADWLRGRFILTPHAAFFNQESHAEMRRKGAEEALRVLQGHAARNCVNREYLVTSPARDQALSATGS